MVRIELIIVIVAVAHAQYAYPPPGTPGLRYEYAYDQYNPGAPVYDDEQLTYPNGPSYPSGPSKPSVGPSYLSVPAYPQGQSYPSGPSNPSGPSHPKGQSYPSGQTYPSGPSYPNSSSNPSGPSYPKGQSYPSGQTYQSGPSYPKSPSNPSGPSYPNSQSYPSGPSNPKGPSYSDDYNDYDPNYDYKVQGLYSPGAYQCGYNEDGKVWAVNKVCFAYFLCVKGEALYRQCNDNYRFDSATGKCVADKSCTTACPNGWYAHPNNIYKFILGGQEMDCPLGTYFDFKICTCNHNYLMPRRYSY